MLLSSISSGLFVGNDSLSPFIHYTSMFFSSLASSAPLFIKATSLIGPGAYFTLRCGVGIRGDLIQTKTYTSSKATSQHTSPYFFLPSLWSLVKQRLQPSRVRSIVIALQGNLVCQLWILPIVGSHSFELPGQLHAEQKHLSAWSFIIYM